MEPARCITSRDEGVPGRALPLAKDERLASQSGASARRLEFWTLAGAARLGVRRLDAALASSDTGLHRGRR
jgi:hypothetical protein